MHGKSSKDPKIIRVAQDFTRYPAGRYMDDGPYTGERFRKEHLVPALKESDLVEVHMDGTRGYGSSFLEEAFGGLVREDHIPKDVLRRKLKIVSSDEFLIDEIFQYIEDAEPNSNK